MREIVNAHRLFRPYYDKISANFIMDNVGDLADYLDEFCRRNIRYKEETSNWQSTALPTGILTRGYGDCKHYASFIGGVLDSLNRKYGAGIDWYYYFSAYRKKAKEPYHVFIGLNDGRGDIWIDPTPGGGAKPTLLIKRKV